ncbi:HEPN domain-containing protein [Psychrobacter sp. Ps6]|uniref:HEPN domain-containing protein n=1 Tax=Psychrobacter sp. Ps6 TaxID=2790960 RepID=UPI001EDD273C|nr:HEPN domain-containing protein [Psychrobacter sp. Ps6]MCG3877900.1 hypothetical protein [Psychrobacter sp. Ps6]
MYNSYKNFLKNIEDVKSLTTVYSYLTNNVTVPLCFDDLLRAQIVNSLSAFDKLIHDLVRIGIVEIFKGSRIATPKYLSEPLKMDIYHKISNINSTTIEAEFEKLSIFEQSIYDKLKFISYQDPSKISDGLSYIVSDNSKWFKISEHMSMKESEIKTQLKLIVSRRNSIVHESDINPQDLNKLQILQIDCENCIDFISKLGEAIYSLAKQP